MLCLFPFAFSKNAPFPVTSSPQKLTPLMERELRGCFDFFWEEWNSDPKSPTYGMSNGDYVGLNKYSPIPIEHQGFYFAAIVIGVERGWITRKEGEKRILITLKTLKNLKRINGFWYHFIDPDTGKRGWKDSHNIELSNASAGTMLLGALAASEYFGGEIQRLTHELYSKMNWKWFTIPETKHPYLACYPEDLPDKVPPGINEDGMFGGWSAYSEHIFLYILAAGAPKSDFATGSDSYYAMKTYKGRYKGEEFIICGTGAAFTYQWTHAFIDFRNLRDKLGRDWFSNSRHASLAARQYAIENAHRIKASARIPGACPPASAHPPVTAADTAPIPSGPGTSSSRTGRSPPMAPSPFFPSRLRNQRLLLNICTRSRALSGNTGSTTPTATSPRPRVISPGSPKAT